MWYQIRLSCACLMAAVCFMLCPLAGLAGGGSVHYSDGAPAAGAKVILCTPLPADTEDAPLETLETVALCDAKGILSWLRNPARGHPS